MQCVCVCGTVYTKSAGVKSDDVQATRQESPSDDDDAISVRSFRQVDCTTVILSRLVYDSTSCCKANSQSSGRGQTSTLYVFETVNSILTKLDT